MRIAGRDVTEPSIKRAATGKVVSATQSVLVSSCLLGKPVRYHGRGIECEHPVLMQWIAEGRVVAVCPEVEGGLPTPRPPAEIQTAMGGQLVLSGKAQVIDATGRDVSPAFISGAHHVLETARIKGIQVAVLKEGSPSCGSSYTYDGSFRGVRVPKAGVTTACLCAAGIRVFSEAQLPEAAEYIAQLEDTNAA